MKAGWLVALAAAAAVIGPPAAAPDWPPVSPETRPWTRWWWMGSAVDPPGITRELEMLRAAGIGGVEITPIYGAVGAESRYVPFLSDDWVGLLEHTLREARRLDLGVDIATGTGWPFGGPWIGDGDAARALAHRTWTLAGGERLREPIALQQTPLLRRVRDVTLEQLRDARPLPLQALVASSSSGGVVDLTSRVSGDGRLDWTAPAGTWTLHGVFLGWHGKQVERAAPGGEGPVIDHFSRAAIQNYLRRFDGAFAQRPLTGLRAFFNDSYEVDDAEGNADGTPRLFEEFERRRGYDLREFLPALFSRNGGDTSARVVADYRETLSDLLLETFTAEWRTWANARGAIVRNQAHGSPANLLDLYAASEIPETEGESIARFKWATSAGHVAGRRLLAAEAATWLGEHFRSTLADVRAAVDRFFLGGVNHIVYHGTAYSPEHEPWPGWLFYAAVEFNPRNPWWRDLSALNDYVTRVQSFLQAGAPDGDVLVYYPFYDSIAAATPGLVHFGGADPPAHGTAFEAVAAALQRRGFTYDYVSDRQLAAVRAVDGRLVTSGGAAYQALVVPASRFVPLETFQRIAALAEGGARVLAVNGFAQDVSGLANLDERRARFRLLRQAIGPRVMQGPDVESLLTAAGVAREPLVDRGLEFARRRYDGGRYYFIVNAGDRAFDGWLPLADASPHAVMFDPMSGHRGDAQVRRSAAGIEIRVSISRQASIVVATAAAPSGTRYPLFQSAGAAVTIGGPWQLRSVAGGPAPLPPRELQRLESWTTMGDAGAQFSGTASYATTFVKPAAAADAWRLDLGSVRESARVRLNGRDVATLIGPEFAVTLEPAQLADVNRLEIEVSNLMANRIAALDKAGVAWRRFHNINFPSRFAENRGADGLFSAAAWAPAVSGLHGPVTLRPLAR